MHMYNRTYGSPCTPWVKKLFTSMRISLQMTQFKSSSNTWIKSPWTRIWVSVLADSRSRCEFSHTVWIRCSSDSRFSIRCWQWRSWFACVEFWRRTCSAGWKTKRIISQSLVIDFQLSQDFSWLTSKEYAGVPRQDTEGLFALPGNNSVSADDRTELDPSSILGPLTSVCSDDSSVVTTLILLRAIPVISVGDIIVTRDVLGPSGVDGSSGDDIWPAIGFEPFWSVPPLTKR